VRGAPAGGGFAAALEAVALGVGAAAGGAGQQRGLVPWAWIMAAEMTREAATANHRPAPLVTTRTPTTSSLTPAVTPVARFFDSSPRSGQNAPRRRPASHTEAMPGRSFDDANAFHRLMRRFASTTAGVALLRPTAHHLDRLVAKATGGRSSFAGLATGIPVVMLTTTGAKSGEPRTVPVYGIPHPEGLALIASNFGGAKHPAWYFNLKAHPEATVTVGRDSWPATARLATPDERDQIWAKGVELYPGWREYEVRAGDRHIEAFILSRAPA
jgi:deazaflavin-dependent oxidoreductase (nitroreductase family)